MSEQNVAEKAEEKEKKVVNRRKFRNDEWTDEQVEARKQELTVEAVPTEKDGRPWVKLAEVATAFRVAGIPVSRLVRATGGDRGMGSPINDLWKIVYVGSVRYMNPDVLTKGVEAMKADPSLATTPRVRKPKAEGETGAVKSAKKGKEAPAKEPAKKVEKTGSGEAPKNVWEYKKK